MAARLSAVRQCSDGGLPASPPSDCAPLPVDPDGAVSSGAAVPFCGVPAAGSVVPGDDSPGEGTLSLWSGAVAPPVRAGAVVVTGSVIGAVTTAGSLTGAPVAGGATAASRFSGLALWRSGAAFAA